MSFLSIDQSTSSTTVFIFDQNLNISKKVSKKHQQIYTQEGYIEHDANEIYNNLLGLIKEIKPSISTSPDFISITNQRETFVIFDKETGRPLCNAIVWQCRRGQEICDTLARKSNLTEIIINKTGLKLDTYFPASKLKWLCDKTPSIREKLENGQALFGTIDTYLLYRLTKGDQYLTDSTNASRTLLYDTKNQHWDETLKEIFGLSKIILPEVRESSSNFGSTNFEDIFDALRRISDALFKLLKILSFLSFTNVIKGLYKITFKMNIKIKNCIATKGKVAPISNNPPRVLSAKTIKISSFMSIFCSLS